MLYSLLQCDLQWLLDGFLMVDSFELNNVHALPQDYIPRSQVPPSCSPQLPVMNPSELWLPCAFYSILQQGCFIWEESLGKYLDGWRRFSKTFEGFLLGGVRWVLKMGSVHRNMRSFLENIFSRGISDQNERRLRALLWRHTRWLWIPTQV